MASGKKRLSWPSYDPGELRHIVQIQKQADRVDSIGQPVQVWETILTTRGAIDEVRDMRVAEADHEFFQQNIIDARTSHIITIRWAKSVQIIPGMRAYYLDQRYSPPAVHIYQIVFAGNVELRDVLLRLGCWEINAPA